MALHTSPSLHLLSSFPPSSYSFPSLISSTLCLSGTFMMSVHFYNLHRFHCVSQFNVTFFPLPLAFFNSVVRFLQYTQGQKRLHNSKRFVGPVLTSRDIIHHGTFISVVTGHRWWLLKWISHWWNSLEKKSTPKNLVRPMVFYEPW